MMFSDVWDVFGGLGEIRIRERVSVFTPGHAIPARPVRPLPYASRGMRGWLRSNDLRFWRPLLYLLSYAHRRSCRLIAKDAGVGRESLYKSLSKDGNPSFQTIAKVIHALGGRLTIQAA